MDQKLSRVRVVLDHENQIPLCVTALHAQVSEQREYPIKTERFQSLAIEATPVFLTEWWVKPNRFAALSGRQRMRGERARSLTWPDQAAEGGGYNSQK